MPSLASWRGKSGMISGFGIPPQANQSSSTSDTINTAVALTTPTGPYGVCYFYWPDHAPTTAAPSRMLEFSQHDQQGRLTLIWDDDGSYGHKASWLHWEGGASGYNWVIPNIADVPPAHQWAHIAARNAAPHLGVGGAQL